MSWLIPLAGVSTSLIVWPSLADPINLPKMFILTIFSAWILGSVVVSLISGKRTKLPLGYWAIAIFTLGLLVAALLTDVKYVAFFGTTRRNDGAFSYLALAILSLASMMAFKSVNVKFVRRGVLVVGFTLATYGFLQSRGHDPFHWTLIYGPVIGTLGNPDFVSGFLGVSAIATLWVIVAEGKMFFRVAAILPLLFELFIVKRSGSIQGFVTFVIGFAILITVKLWNIRKVFGLTALMIVGIGSIPVILGFMNKGPLAAKIYRSTLKNRLDYWHSAINMFKAHPLVGVGLDRFADNYRQYVPQVQVAPAQSTDNAHNVFLQLLATGGLVVILPYLFLLGVIFWTAVRAIKASQGEAQIGLTALFAVWFGFLLVSSISIDNLGIAVWFWIFGGALYGVAHRSLTFVEEAPAGKKNLKKSSRTATPSTSNTLAPIVSLVFAIVALIIMLPAWRSSAMLMNLQRTAPRLNQTQFVAAVKQVASIQPNDVQTLFALSDIAQNYRYSELSLTLAQEVNKKDPRSYFGNDIGAIVYERIKKYPQAIPFRIRLTELDPWNTANMLQLVTDYVQVKDMAKAQIVAARITALQPGGLDAKAAATLLKG